MGFSTSAKTGLTDAGTALEAAVVALGAAYTQFEAAHAVALAEISGQGDRSRLTQVAGYDRVHGLIVGRMLALGMEKLLEGRPTANGLNKQHDAASGIDTVLTADIGARL